MKILVWEDHKIVNQNICLFLKDKKIQVSSAFNWEEILEKIKKEKFDLLILDLMLPKKDWIQVCKEIRENSINIPILILTALDSVNNKIKWLDAWADDYLVKPFSLEELFARIKALSRRKDSFIKNEIIWWEWKINSNLHKVFKWKTEINLTTREFDFLYYLAKNRWKNISKNELLEEVWWWWDSLLFSETIEVHASYLRKKLWKDVFKTIRNVWYIIE